MSAVRGSRGWVVGGVLLAVLLVAVTYVAVIGPARTEVASVQSQVDDAVVQQSVLRHRLHDLETASKDVAALHAQLAAARAALPDRPDTQGLLRQLQTLAAARQVTVESVAIGTSEASGVAGVSQLPVSVSLVGRADDLVAALGDLQSGRQRLVTVAGSSLKQVLGAAFRLSLDVRVFATGTPTAAGAAGGTPADTTAGAASAAGTAADTAAAEGPTAS